MERFKGIGFYGVADFCVNAKNIKSAYEKMGYCEKRMYKYYVYSNSFLTMKEQNLIWEYLNEPFGSVYYLSYEQLLCELNGE